MKIHDKFVIELREVIKGYGNDPTVQDPCKFPCDYKFYEISGVAICEESFKKMKPLTEEINSVLDEIRAEIKKYEADCRLQGGTDECKKCNSNVFESIYRIIDKYKAESEDKE